MTIVDGLSGVTPVVLPRSVLRALRPSGLRLDSWWLATTLVVLAALALLVLVVLGRRRRPRRRMGARLAAAGCALLLCLLAAGAVADAVSGYVPTPDAAQLLLTGRASVGGGRLRTASIGAPRLHVPDSTTYVYLPPGYDRSGTRRYPVAYLVHGEPGTSADWFAGGDAAHTLDVLIAHHLVPPMIVVAPDVNGGGLHDTECLDDPRPGRPQIETYLRDVVVPYVDAHYRTQAVPAARILGGMSAGGFCALDQGLRHRDTYGPVIALEPYGDPGQNWRAVLGDARYAQVSPSAYLPTMALPQPVPTFVDIGSQAKASELADTDHVEAELRQRGQPVLRRTEPGLGHGWTMARVGLPYGLVFAARYLPAAG